MYPFTLRVFSCDETGRISSDPYEERLLSSRATVNDLYALFQEEEKRLWLKVKEPRVEKSLFGEMMRDITIDFKDIVAEENDAGGKDYWRRTDTSTRDMQGSIVHIPHVVPPQSK